MLTLSLTASVPQDGATVPYTTPGAGGGDPVFRLQVRQYMEPGEATFSSGVTEPPDRICRLGDTGSPSKWKVSTAKATLLELMPS